MSTHNFKTLIPEANPRWNPAGEDTHPRDLIGWVVEKKLVENAKFEKPGVVFTIEDEKGDLHDLWGSTMLNKEDKNSLGGQPIGTFVCISFKGLTLKKDAKKGSKNTMDYFNLWEVGVDEAMSRKPSFNGAPVANNNEVNERVATSNNAAPVEPPVDDSLPF